MSKNIDVSQLSPIELKIFKLKEEGHSYRVISKKLSEDDINISYERVRKYCNDIYNKLGIKEPKSVRKKPKSKIDDYKEEIFKLKENGMSYKNICEYLNEHHITVSQRTISNMFNKNSNKKVNCYSNAVLRIRKVMSDEEIFNLSKQGCPYNDIVNLIYLRGVNTSYNTVKRICERIYRDKGLSKPVLAVKKTKRIDIPFDKIIELKNNGLSYEDIAEYFTKHGTKVSVHTILNRRRELEDEFDIILPKNKSGRKKLSASSKLKMYSKDSLRREILKLGEKKKASQEQLQLFAKKISEIYGEEINIDPCFENNKEHEDR